MFEGFPRRVRFVPVPSPVFGPLLEQIGDLAELKCMLRVIWLLHEKKGYPKYVTLKELLADRTLVTALKELLADRTLVTALADPGSRRGQTRHEPSRGAWHTGKRTS